MSDVNSEHNSHVAPDQMSADPAPIRRAYDLNGVTLAVAAAEERPAAFLDPILAPLRCATPSGCDWVISLSPSATIEPPTSGHRIFEGPLPEGLPSVMVKDGDERILVVPGHFDMRFRRAVRTTEIRFVPGKEGGLGGTAAFWMLDDLLAAYGRHLLHGALLVDPATDRVDCPLRPERNGEIDDCAGARTNRLLSCGRRRAGAGHQ